MENINVATEPTKKQNKVGKKTDRSQVTVHKKTLKDLDSILNRVNQKGMVGKATKADVIQFSLGLLDAEQIEKLRESVYTTEDKQREKLSEIAKRLGARSSSEAIDKLIEKFEIVEGKGV